MPSSTTVADTNATIGSALRPAAWTARVGSVSDGSPSCARMPFDASACINAAPASAGPLTTTIIAADERAGGGASAGPGTVQRSVAWRSAASSTSASMRMVYRPLASFSSTVR